MCRAKCRTEAKHTVCLWSPEAHEAWSRGKCLAAAGGRAGVEHKAWRWLKVLLSDGRAGSSESWSCESFSWWWLLRLRLCESSKGMRGWLVRLLLLRRLCL